MEIYDPDGVTPQNAIVIKMAVAFFFIETDFPFIETKLLTLPLQVQHENLHGIMQNSRKIADSSTLDFYSANTNSQMPLPFVDGGIAAGFPSPAQDYIDLKIDLNTELINNPTSTFYAKVKGTSMQDAGIMDGDILVVDKSLDPKDGDTAVCFIDGEFTLKYIKFETDVIYLVPANPKFEPIKVTEEKMYCL